MLGAALEEYEIHQRGLLWQINLHTRGDYHGLCQRLSEALAELCAQQGLQAPQLSFGHLQAPPPHAKRRRLLMLQLPEGLPCVY